MKKILVVEDDISIHNLIKEVLENEHYIVLNAYSGTEALLILEKERPDLILLDLMLPRNKWWRNRKTSWRHSNNCYERKNIYWR